MHRVCIKLSVIFVLLAMQACASVKTVNNYDKNSPKVYSGVRLDVAGIKKENTVKYNTDAPIYPWLDLPFSFVADTLLLPVSFSAAGYYYFFEK